MPVLTGEQESKEESTSSEDSHDEKSKKATNPVKGAKTTAEKTEEFNILNNLVNKILSNLEAKISCVTVRVLTKEMRPESDEDIHTILLRLNNIEYHRSQDCKPLGQGSSDLQTILDGKMLDIQEISVHYMKATHLYPDEFIKSKKSSPFVQSTLPKLHFPFEYPITTHPNTILLLKNPNGKCLEASFRFTPTKVDNQTQLLVSLAMPSVESIIEFQQLRGLIEFSVEISNFIKKDKPIIESKPSSIPSPDKNDMLDVYGEMVRTNQKAMPTTPIMRKHKSTDTVSKKSNLSKNIGIQKEKIIFKFLKSQAQKQDLQKLKDDLKKSIVASQSESVSQIEDGRAQPIDSSMFMSMSQVVPPPSNAPLSIQIDFKLKKASINLVLNEGGQFYDHQYEANSMSEDKADQSMDSRFGYSHYCFELNHLSAFVNVQSVKKKVEQMKQSRSIPLQKELSHDKMITAHAMLKSLSLNRHDIHEGPDPRLHNQSGNDSYNNQFESYVSSSMFRSTNEFYQLNDSKLVGQSIVSSSGMQKRVHNQPGSQQAPTSQSKGQQVDSSQISPEVQQLITNPPILNPVVINPYHQHFCVTQIVQVKQISESIFKKQGAISESDNFLEIQTQTQCETLSKKEKRLISHAKIKVGIITASLGIAEYLVLSCLTKGLSQQQQSSPTETIKKKGQHTLEVIQIHFEGIKIGIVGKGKSEHSYAMTMIGAIIENKAIEQIFQVLSAHNGCSLSRDLININISQVKLSKRADYKCLFKAQAERISVTLPLKDVQLNIASISSIGIELTMQGPKKQDDFNQSQYAGQLSQPYRYFEGGSQNLFQEKYGGKSDLNLSQSKQSPTGQQRNAIRVAITAHHLGIALNLEKELFPYYFEVMSELDETLKLVLVVQDIVKCYNRECRNRVEIDMLRKDDSYLKGGNSFIEFTATPQTKPTNFELDLSIQDIQILLYRNHREPLLKFRVNSSQLVLKHIPPSTLMNVAKKERIQLQLVLGDLILIDYGVQNPQTMQLFTKNASHLEKVNDTIPDIPPIFEKDGSLYLVKFEDDLLINNHRVVAYKQLCYKHFALDFKLEILFKIEKSPFEERVSVGNLASIFVEVAQKQNFLTKFYDEIVQLKKNPMVCKLSIGTNGLTLRAGVIFCTQTVGRVLETLNGFKKGEDTKPKQQSSDRIECSLQIVDTAIDYHPALSKKHYDQIYLSDFVSVVMTQSMDDKASVIQEGQSCYKTALRALVYISELSVTLQNHMSDNKMTSDMTLKCSGLSVRILQNTSESDHDHDPILLLDASLGLDTAGGLLDQLGFCQILYIDQLELKNSQTVKSENVSTDDTQEDLFATSYGSLKTTEIPKEVKPMRSIALTLVSNKIALYICKDTLYSIKQIGQMIGLQVESLVRVISGPQLYEDVSEQVDDDLFQESDSESFQKLLEDLVIADYDQSDELKHASPTKPQQEIKKGLYTINEDDGYFTVNTAICVEIRDDIKKIPQISSLVNMDQYVIENYLPVLNFDDINANRHRECHKLPESFRHLETVVKIHIEVRSIELKMFEGSDFDFVAAKPQSGFRTRMIAEHSLAYLQHRKESGLSDLKASDAGSKRNTVIVLNEDYMPSSLMQSSTLKEESKQEKQFFIQQLPSPQSLKRPRKVARGNYLSVQIGNIIFTCNELNKKDDNLIKRYCVSIQNVILRETVSRKGEQVRELLQIAPYQKHYDNQIQLSIQKEMITQKRDDMGFTLNCQPFKLMLNQGVVNFILQFFEIKIGGSSQDEVKIDELKLSETSRKLMQRRREEKKEIYVNQILIHPSYAILSYTSRSLNILDLTSGNFIELMNILNINDMRMNIARYDLKQRLPLDVATKHLVKFYVDDLAQNQKVSIARALGPLRSVINISGAFYGLLRKPYKAYMADQSVFRGIGEGASSFVSIMSQETNFISQKLIDGVAKVKKAARL